MAPSAMGLQQLINACEKYGIEHDILYNPIKSKCITLNNINLVYENSVKYLGVVIDSKLKDDVDISRQLRSLYASFQFINFKFLTLFHTCKTEAYRIVLFKFLLCYIMG